MTDVDRQIAQIEQIIGRSFANKLTCAEALQMVAPTVAVRVNGAMRIIPKNVNLAILGDSILATVLCGMWDEHRDDRGHPLTPADWTTVRNGLLGNINLARLGFHLGVDRCIITAPFTTPTDKMVATTLEAVIGAICRDAGDNALSAVRAVVEHIGLDDHPLLMFPCMADSGKVDDVVFGLIGRKDRGALPTVGGEDSQIAWTAYTLIEAGYMSRSGV